MTSRTWLRIGLFVLAVTEGVPAVWALIGPESFFTGFPLPGHAWVAAFPPYNDHLVRDLGAATLQFVVILVCALVSLNPHLVRATLLGSLFFAVPHMAFHVWHLGRFAAGDAAGQLTALIIPVILPLVLLWLHRGTSRLARPPSRADAGEPRAPGQ